MTSTPPPLYCAVIYAKDVERVSAFYKATLNLLVLEEAANFKVLGDVDLELNIVQIPAEIAANISISSPPKLREQTPIKPSFLVESIENAAATAVESGGSMQPLNQAWQWRGQRFLDGADPEGNIVQFRARNA